MGALACAEETCSSGRNALKPCAAESVISLDLRVFDLYQIGGILGSGAFGQVRACWPLGGKDDCLNAVKIVDTSAATSVHISAVEEAEILHSVTHPHIVELYEIYQHEDLLFMIQERIAGGELFAAIGDLQTKFTESCVALIGQQLLEALKYLHAMRIVHRDVKAENILLNSRPSLSKDWHVKLIDFGLAMRMEDGPFLFGSCNSMMMAKSKQVICGTLYYCAPEVFTNVYGPKVDLWAAGVLLYLALFGRYPYYDRDPTVVETMICDQELDPSWKPIRAQEHPQYQVSDHACDCLSSLLEKDHLERPAANEALKGPWLKNAGRFLQIESVSDKYLAAGMPIERRCGKVQDIPMVVRIKASRAAARAPVSASMEQSRTAALEALRTRDLSESAKMPSRLGAIPAE
jgi:serine/threonine protein kinase